MEIKMDVIKTPPFVLKAVNSLFIVIAVAIFYSTFNSWAQFVGTTIVSGLIYCLSILVIYVIGGTPIQKTFYELMMNSYYTLMFFIASIVSWIHGESGGTTVATGVFVFICFILFAIDIYLTLTNMGVFNSFGSQATPSVPPTNPKLGISQHDPYPTSVSNPTATQATSPAIMTPVPNGGSNGAPI